MRLQTPAFLLSGLLAASAVLAQSGSDIPPLPLPGQQQPLPMKLDIPDIEKWIAELEKMLENPDADPLVAEELGALYILKGRRDIGLRLIGKKGVLPLPLAGRPSMQPANNDNGHSGNEPPREIDLPSLGLELIKAKSTATKAAGIYLLIMSDMPSAAENALRELPAGFSSSNWLKALLLERTGQAEQAAAEAVLWREQIEQQASLKLRNLTFIDTSFPVNYGDYQELPGSSTSPGDIAMVYAEVIGYKHVQDKRGMTVRFKVDYYIVAADNKVVWRKDRPDIESRTTRVPTRDLFLRSAFYVPMGLAGGAYTFHYEVEDLVSGARSMASTPIIVRDR